MPTRTVSESPQQNFIIGLCWQNLASLKVSIAMLESDEIIKLGGLFQYIYDLGMTGDLNFSFCAHNTHRS